MYCLVINCMTLNILFGAIRTVIIAIIYKTRTFNGMFFISPQSNCPASILQSIARHLL